MSDPEVLMTDWHGKPYYSLDAYCKNTFHHKCYKIALNAHMTCPNRDGSLGTRGCIFCSSGGSGDFAVALSDAPLSMTAGSPLTCSTLPDISRQLREGLSLFGDKKVGSHFIAYFQAYTNTYAPVSYLEQVYLCALKHPDVCGISIATRPDCLNESIILLLQKLRGQFPDKFIWIELGLQTIHASTAEYIRRGYPLPVFELACRQLKSAGIPMIVHMILGLPGETEAMQLETLDYISQLHPFGIKLQLLHVLKNTDLAADYLAGKFDVLSKEAYLTLLQECIARLDPEIVIHRLTGDGSKNELIAPLWSLNKRDVLNSLHRQLKDHKIRQGMRCQVASLI